MTIENSEYLSAARAAKLIKSVRKNELKREQIRKKIFEENCQCLFDDQCKNGYYRNICIPKRKLVELLEAEKILTIQNKTKWTTVQIKRIFPEIKHGTHRHIENILFYVLGVIHFKCVCINDKCSQGNLDNLCITIEKLVDSLNTQKAPTFNRRKSDWDEKEFADLLREMKKFEIDYNQILAAIKKIIALNPDRLQSYIDKP